jgi:hypothetical protein
MRFATSAALCLLARELPAVAAPWDRPGRQLTFQDELDGAEVDAGKWLKRYKWGEAQINGSCKPTWTTRFSCKAVS